MLDLYDVLPIKDLYKDNSREEYFEIVDRAAGSRKRKGADAEVLQNKFRNISAPPPLKGAPAQSGRARRYSTEDEDEESEDEFAAGPYRDFGHDGVSDWDYESQNTVTMASSQIPRRNYIATSSRRRIRPDSDE